MFWSVGWPLLRTEGFFYNLDILYIIFNHVKFVATKKVWQKIFFLPPSLHHTGVKKKGTFIGLINNWRRRKKGTISDCLKFKWPWRKKIIHMLTLLPKGVQTIIWHPQVVHLELRISPRIFETALMGFSGAWGKLIHAKKSLLKKISWHCPFKQVTARQDSESCTFE